jgi:hypothetical protein
MIAETEHGYLVMADISGFTSYLAKVELDHAHEILTDLMTVIVDQFKQILTISKLEGDAVFANTTDASLPSGERLLELIENTYFAFRFHRDACQRQTTCTCRACQSIPALDLKFFVHHGEYIVQNISGIRELVGTDVNLLHRLMKNHISETVGWRAYAMFTQKALEQMQIQASEMHQQVEHYEHLGDIPTLSMDMNPRYENMVTSRRVMIAPEDADYQLQFDFDAAPYIVWDWITNINRRSQAMGESGHWSNVIRPGGRNGIGTVNHCAHGKGTSEETILDWRPFEYATCHTVDGKVEYRSMYIFTPLEDGEKTHLELRMKLFNPKPLWLSRLMVKAQFAKDNPYLWWFKTIENLMKSGNGTALP